VHTNPCARPWVGARLRATVAMASGSPSRATGLLPVPAPPRNISRQPPPHSSEHFHTNPSARPWVGARLRATAAIPGVRRYRLSQSRSGRAGRVAPGDRRRSFESARGSALECAAIEDALAGVRCVVRRRQQQAKGTARSSCGHADEARTAWQRAQRGAWRMGWSVRYRCRYRYRR
jgi:hypothetical protein